ncbi:MAG TPA: hypothetical protein VJ376_08860 [Pseudomonadota bacterium]|nr:hypothetical protein [Pseudomonadota bacterium]
MSTQGLYRKRNGWGDQHSVRVKYDGALELEVPENFYRGEGWQPPFDELPWHGESKHVPDVAADPPSGGDQQESDGQQTTEHG